MDNFKPYGAVPSARQMEHYRIEKKAFFHFGVNTFTDLEWGEGSEKESVFNPVGCDCREWIRDIRKAGFKLAIITAKHHDGFCLWPSKYTEHSIKNSPYKGGRGDILKEFTDACHEYGMRVGVYISPWDRNSPYWGSTEYSKFFNLQLTELLSNYGRIDEVWWDGAGSQDTPYDWGMWAHTVRSLQPDAVIFGSQGATPYVEMRWVGNESGYAGNPCFATIDPHALEVEHTPTLNSGTPDGERFIIAEVDTSIRPGWFFHEDQEKDVKSVAQLTELWFDSVGSNANMLLNFPPDRTGHLAKKDIENAQAAHDIISRARSVNLAARARVSGGADNILCDDGSLFVPDGNTVTVTLEFDKKISFNMFEISEAIEYGHRVRGFRVVADGKVLYDGKCIGYKWAEHFDRVEVDSVTLEIYDAKDIPLIRYLALYSIDEGVFYESERIKSGKDIVKKITRSENSAEIEFGGIYPFNTVVFNGERIWRYNIEVFDGAKYNLVYEGSKPYKTEAVTLDKTYRDCYKIRFNVTKGVITDEFEVKVIEL